MKIKFIIFLLYPVLLFSQHTVRIKTIDDDKVPIQRAIVAISQEDNQIAFGTTDANGFIEKQLAAGTYIITIKKLGFAPITEVFLVQKEELFTYTLFLEMNKLKDVVITSRPKVMRVKEDTLSYNLKAVVDGTENKIEDVIKKLPGLAVDQDGKVLYKGQQIDNVLIDGNEFFGKKHQMATQNINAEMIEGIDLLTNFGGFALASGGQKGVALNLKTKEGYKNKWIHDIEQAVGINNALQWHSNSFNFFKKGNMAVISDYNTIAKTPISREDYSQMRIVADASGGNGETNSVETPSFLNPNAFLKDKKNAFIGLNYTSLIGAKSKITLANIINNSSITEEILQSQTTIGAAQNTIFFGENKKAGYLLANSAFKWEYNRSKTTFIAYTAGFTPNSDRDNQEVIQLANEIDYLKENRNFSFAQVANIHTTVFKSIAYKGMIKHAMDRNKQNLRLFSQQNLFGSSQDSIYQRQKNDEITFSIQNGFSKTLGSSTLSLQVNFFSQENNFSNSGLQDDATDLNLNLLRQSFKTQLSWLKKWNPKLESIIGLTSTMVSSTLATTQSSFTRVEPNMSLSYNLKGLNKLSFNYGLYHQLPSINQLQQVSIIEDFQTIERPTSINFQQIIPKNSFSLQYFSIGTKNQNVFFSNLSYDVEENAVSNNTEYNADFIETTAITTRNRKSIKGLALYDLKFKRLPFSIKTTLFYLKSIGFSQFDGVDNQIGMQNLTNRLQLTSNFRKSAIQFGVDYNFIRKTLEQSITDFTNTTQNHQLTLSLRGKNSTKLKWDLGLTMDNQDSGFSKNKTYFLNANIQYVFAKDFKIIFNGNNVLNLNKSQIISTSFNQSFFTESIVSIRPGYVMLGINYSL
jgi:hypothetical protein